MKHPCLALPLALALLLLLHQPVCAQTLDAGYFTLDLPKGWDVITPPTREGETVSLVVARTDRRASVSIVSGPTRGTRMDMIAAMFAQLFQAQEPPAQQGNLHTVPFARDGVSGRLWMTESQGIFIVYSLPGDDRDAQNMGRSAVKSERYPGLVLP